jgi:predicted nucleic acid-binding protein
VDGTVNMVIHKLNLLEVYYDKYRLHGKVYADDLIEHISSLPLEVHEEITDEIFVEAGRLKATYEISLADAIALAETSICRGKLLTSDHHEFDVIEAAERTFGFLWIR